MVSIRLGRQGLVDVGKILRQIDPLRSHRRQEAWPIQNPPGSR